MLSQLDAYPLGAIWRIVVGAVVVPASSVISGSADAVSVIAVFLVTLAALRVLPAIARRILPFSAELRSEWAERRQLAVRYDSYQWQKLLWIGLGLGGYLLLTDETAPAPLVLATVSIIGGALGLFVWRRRLAQMTAHTEI
jgi:hypothetical protein